MARFFGKPEAAWLVAAVIAAALLAGSLFLPLWRMQLVAPQYPEGLVMHAYGNRFEGDDSSYYDDVREINGLNHYIGMKPIEPVREMDLFFPGVIATLVAGIAVSFIAWKRAWFRALAVAGFWFIPVFFVIDLQYWLYKYGHSMDPDAALNTGAFTPKVIGTTKVWNFHSVTSLEVGFYLMVLAAIAVTFLPTAIRLAQARFAPGQAGESAPPRSAGEPTAAGRTA
jgi:copper chaperone NosL